MSLIFSTKNLSFDYVCIKSGYTKRLIKNGKDFMSHSSFYSEYEYPEVCGIVDHKWRSEDGSPTTVWYDSELKDDIDKTQGIDGIFGEGIILFKYMTEGSEYCKLRMYDVTSLITVLGEDMKFYGSFGMSTLCDIEIVKLASGKIVGVFEIDA